MPKEIDPVAEEFLARYQLFIYDKIFRPAL
jgi:hypothetical protein